MQSIKPWGRIFGLLCHFKISAPLNTGIDPRTKVANKTKTSHRSWESYPFPHLMDVAGALHEHGYKNLTPIFQLNSMTEVEAIKFATLHLDGEAHEWWYHGLVTLGHSNITSYLDFTQKLMEQFDKKDPKMHFRELA